MSLRIDPHSYTNDMHWGEHIARKVVEAFPNEELYTCAAGISPSGIVHFGNFRDVITAYVVSKELEKMGKKTRVLFSWDDFDRLRKVPANVPEIFAENIGKPLAMIASPFSTDESYAKFFETPMEQAMTRLGITLTYRYQSKEYTSGVYSDAIVEALRARKEIAKILLSFMTEKAMEEKKISASEYVEQFYPVSVYSRFTGKDATEIRSYDDSSELLTYYCHETKQEDSINVRTSGLVKLQWKVDWPMRWRHESVVFEPGGHDHASPGSSYDIATVIAPTIFHRSAPVFAEYKFVGLSGLGAKMSGSKGNAVSPLQLLEIYEPEVLKWLYMKKTPAQAFTLAFDTEIYRQFDEFDREVELYKENKLDAFSMRALELSLENNKTIFENTPIPFRQAVAFGQIAQWDLQKMTELLSRSGLSYSTHSITSRLPCAKNWLMKYNPSEMIVVRDVVNRDYITTLNEASRLNIKALADFLDGEIDSIEQLEKMLYAIPKDETLDQKENAKRQRAFFKDVYQLLISTDTGPRLSTFIWALGKEKVRTLLAV
jgi:lysyl-tRNA synthetase class 1